MSTPTTADDLMGTFTAVARQKRKEDGERRVAAYSDWRRQLGDGLYAVDVDFVEWRFDRGPDPRPVGLIEATLVEDGVEVTDRYLGAIVARYHGRGLQGRATRHVARALGCGAHVVLFRPDCDHFWVHDLLAPTAPWRTFDSAGMKAFIAGLGVR